MKCQLSLVICTYRRAESLKVTLSNVVGQLDDSIDWQLIVVDNADDCDTQLVADSFKQSLPIELLVEKTPGQNNARNTAIPYIKGDLVVFTDDDTVPQRGWLKELLAAASKQLNCDVFGGKILPVYPGEHRPWQADAWFANFAFAHQDLGDVAIRYPLGSFPSSPNMAMRRCVFDEGNAFDGGMGPIGGKRISGSEAEFFSRILKEYDAYYVPSAVVHHLVSPRMLEHDYLKSRCYAMGLGMAVWASDLENEANLKRMFKVPRYRYGRLLKAVYDSLIAALVGNKTEYATHVYRAALELGYIAGSLKRSRR